MQRSGPVEGAYFMHKLPRSAGELQAVKRVATIAMVVSLHFTPPAMAQTPYDGVWNVTILTKAGSCEPTAHYVVKVADGKVSGPQYVSGLVGREGNVKVSF